ncbi:MAG: hypothetical protein JNL96_01770 [Planctomycetaceae bacterium]|nr:hypothetical protein [Planctomycetaceae bacterium]
MPRIRPSSTTAALPERPAGAPDWITAELLADTVAAWQPHYPQSLTADDALEILLTVGRLFEALGDDEDEENEVLGAGAGQQP